MPEDATPENPPIARITPQGAVPTGPRANGVAGGGGGDTGGEVVPSVLVVDDSRTIREGMRDLLADRGYAVETAADGAEALDALQVGQVDLLILDLQMPNTDGFAVLERLSQVGHRTPVVLLSGLPAAAIQDRLGELRAQKLPPLFLKPVDFDQLLGVVDLMLSGDLPDFDD